MLGTFKAPFTFGHTAAFQNGLYKRTYTGNFDGDPTWFTGKTPTATNLITGSVSASIAETTTHQFLGWFKAPYTENFTFTLTSDDKSLLWVGDNAKAGTFAFGNKLAYANVGSNSGTIPLTKGTFYALRLQVSNGTGPGYITLAVSSSQLGSTQNLTQLSYFNPNTQGI